MRYLAAIVLAVAPTMVTADCSSERAILLSALHSSNYTLQDPGTFAEDQGTCRQSDLVLAQDILTIEVASLIWRLEGIEALTIGSGRISLTGDLDGLRITPRTEDAWISYMLAEQNRRSDIDATLFVWWDFPDGRFELASLDIDFPGENRFSFGFRATGVSPQLLRGDTTALKTLVLEHLALEVENRGFADGLILGAVIGKLSAVPGSPESVIDGTKRDLRALVSNLPGNVFDADTKAALVALITAGPVPWGEVFVQIATQSPIPLAPFLSLGAITPDTLSAAFLGGTVSVIFNEEAVEN